MTANSRHGHACDCFWCGDTMFEAGDRMICCGCAWSVSVMVTLQEHRPSADPPSGSGPCSRGPSKDVGLPASAR